VVIRQLVFCHLNVILHVKFMPSSRSISIESAGLDTASLILHGTGIIGLRIEV